MVRPGLSEYFVVGGDIVNLLSFFLELGFRILVEGVSKDVIKLADDMIGDKDLGDFEALVEVDSADNGFNGVS